MPLKEKISCHWPWGGIVVREVFPRRRQIEYRYDRVRSCNRIGAKGTGRFGGVHRT